MESFQISLLIHHADTVTRMTIAQLIECILGKVGCYTGNIGNGTAFDRMSVDNISKMLLSWV